MQIFTDKAVSELIYSLARLEAELAALWSRLDGLDKIMAHHAGTAAQLEELKSETAEWIDDLQDEDMRQAARLDELEVIVSGNDRTFREIITDNAELAARIKRLEKIIDTLKEESA